MGTLAWNHWKSSDLGDEAQEDFDEEVHSDVRFTGGPVSFGPFSLQIVLRGSEPRGVGNALLLTWSAHAMSGPELVAEGKLLPADSGSYHGAGVSHEIAALVSLEMGVRLRVAGMRRSSGLYSHGHSGVEFEVEPLALPGRDDQEQLPHTAQRATNINDLKLVARLSSLPEDTEVALVRAARSYASAIWWANEDPNQAWISLVSAIEAVAPVAIAGEMEPVEAIGEYWPELKAALETVSPEVQHSVCELLADQVRVARKFREFIVRYAPPPPEPRPEVDALDWNMLAKEVGKVYGHRSKALHTATPFPHPMCDLPRIWPNGAVQESPLGLSASAFGASWDASETPMLLSTFEYLVRGSLTRWWEEQLA